MEHIIVIREYMATPIFCSNDDNMGHVDVDALPVTDELKNKLKLWHADYQSTFDENYPPNSGFICRDADQAHIERGRQLAEQLRIELGEGYKVEYSAS